jgi:probable HAF family extracellular repeat protein
MSEIGKRACAVAVLFLTIPLVCAQDAVTTIQLPDGRTSQLTFTTIDVPGAGFTGAEGINTAGDVVGYYGDTNSGPFHSFLLSGGLFTFIDYPGASSTVATGINDSGVVIGYTGNIRVHGFLYEAGTFVPIRHGTDTATFTMGINNVREVVGGTGTVNTTKGFELRGHTFRKVAPPGSHVYVYATGVNNFGDVVGWDDSGGFASSHGRFKTIQFPGADLTEALGLNDSGVIVGWYFVGGSAFGFSIINRQYTSFAYPGAKGTLPRGINASGQVVGEYTFDFKFYHGFVTNSLLGSVPVEP